MFLLSYLIASLIRYIYNRISDYRLKKFLTSLPADADPVEVKIEIFGLGRYFGFHLERNSIPYPIDILMLFVDQYKVPLGELTNAYSKGVTDALKDKDIYIKYRQERISQIFGTPEKLKEG